MAIEGFYAVNAASRVAYYVFMGMLLFFATQVEIWRILVVGSVYAAGFVGMEVLARQNSWIGQNDLAAARRWRNRFLPWLCMCGFGWALMPVLFDIPGRVEFQAIAYLSLVTIVYGNLVERSIDWLTFKSYHLIILAVCCVGTIEPLFADYSLPRLAVFLGFLGGMAYCWQRAKAQRQLELERIRLTVETAHAHEQLHQAYQKLEKAAAIDQLTGLNNRAQLDIVMKAEVARAGRYGHAFSVILMDIDNFKHINDEWGHPTGDAVLRDIGQIVSSGVRQPDIAGRWGGEEFLILCPETSCGEAVSLAERIRRMIEGHAFLDAGHCTGSFGVATLHGDESESSVLKRADEALYDAKKQGKNLVLCHCDHQSEHATV